MLDRACFVFSKAVLSMSVQTILEFLLPLLMAERGAVIWEEFEMKRWQKLTAPRKLRSWVTVTGRGSARMVSRRSGNG